jgi:hypothetical protein
MLLQLVVVVDTMVILKVDMKIMVTLLLLPLARIPTCTEVIRVMLVTNTHNSNSSKWDIAKNSLSFFTVGFAFLVITDSCSFLPLSPSPLD